MVPFELKSLNYIFIEITFNFLHLIFIWEGGGVAVPTPNAYHYNGKAACLYHCEPDPLATADCFGKQPLSQARQEHLCCCNLHLGY